MPIGDSSDGTQPIASARGRVIVLGMHRSGTSCISHVLTTLGMHYGDPGKSIGSSPENPKGFFERRDVRFICDEILRGAGCDWRTASDFAASRVPAAVASDARRQFDRVLENLELRRPWFIKEPRLCFVWPVLEAQVPDAVFIHVWRHPAEVARSLLRRNGIPTDVGLTLWEAYVRTAHAVTRGRPSVIVSYNELLKNPEEQVRRLVAQLRSLGVSDVSAPDERELRTAIDPALYRNQMASPVPHDLPAEPQQRLVAALASGDPASPELFEPLSAESHNCIEAWNRDARAAAAAMAARDLEAGRGGPRGSVVGLLFRGIGAGRSIDRNSRWRQMALHAHYRWLRWRRDAPDLVELAASGYFDADYYLRRYPDIVASRADPLLHYVKYGASEGRDPSGYFNTNSYVSSNADAVGSGMNPLSHFLRNGGLEKTASGSARRPA